MFKLITRKSKLFTILLIMRVSYIIILIVQQKYIFSDLYLAKYLDTLAKLFFLCNELMALRVDSPKYRSSHADTKGRIYFNTLIANVSFRCHK